MPLATRQRVGPKTIALRTEPHVALTVLIDVDDKPTHVVTKIANAHGLHAIEGAYPEVAAAVAEHGIDAARSSLAGSTYPGGYVEGIKSVGIGAYPQLSVLDV